MIFFFFLKKTVTSTLQCSQTFNPIHSLSSITISRVAELSSACRGFGLVNTELAKCLPKPPRVALGALFRQYIIDLQTWQVKSYDIFLVVYFLDSVFLLFMKILSKSSIYSTSTSSYTISFHKITANL